MELSLEEQEKLLNKAIALFNEIKDIKIREIIEINVNSKYYEKGYRGYNKGFTKYFSGCCIDNEDIGNCIEELKNYINFKLYDGSEYINDKFVGFTPSKFTINALLDFVYYGDYIIKEIKKINEERNNELKSLLD